MKWLHLVDGSIHCHDRTLLSDDFLEVTGTTSVQRAGGTDDASLPGGGTTRAAAVAQENDEDEEGKPPKSG